MSGSERGALPVQLPGPAMRALVRAVALMSEADLGRWAVIGGVAVAARLGLAHRRSGAVAAALREAPDALSAAVLLATDTVLVTGATRTRSWLRTSGGVQATVGAEEIRALGQQLLDGLS